jgi:hypothetical protein
MWWSPDKVRWHRADGDELENATVNNIVGGFGGFVAVGATVEADSSMPAAWFSRDGEHWTRAELPAGAAQTGRVGRVVRGGRGFIAVGTVDAQQRVWTSVDGARWEVSPAPWVGQQAVDIGAGDDDQVVAISEPPGVLGGSLWLTRDGIVWESLDGYLDLSWRLLEGYRDEFPAGSPDDVTFVDGTWVVAGSTPGRGGDRTFGGWTSTDLVTWTAMPSKLSGEPSGGPDTADGVQMASGGRRVVTFSQGTDQRWYWTWSPARGATEQPATATPMVTDLGREVGPNGDRCLEVTADGTTARGCLRLPGFSVWRVGGTDYIVASWALELSDGESLRADNSGFVVVPYAEYSHVVRPNCLSTALNDAVIEALGTPGPLFMVTGCNPSYAWVAPQWIDRPGTSEALLFEARGDAWTRVATVDFDEPDRTKRCSVVPSGPAPQGGLSALEFCLLLG